MGFFSLLLVNTTEQEVKEKNQVSEQEVLEIAPNGDTDSWGDSLSLPAQEMGVRTGRDAEFPQHLPVKKGQSSL